MHVIWDTFVYDEDKNRFVDLINIEKFVSVFDPFVINYFFKFWEVYKMASSSKTEKCPFN